MRPLAVSTVLRAALHSLDLTQEELAKKMRVNQRTVLRLVNSQCRLTPRMAVLLESATGRPAAEWLSIQSEYELAQLRGKK